VPEKNEIGNYSQFLSTFVTDVSLRNIETGVVAEPDVNVDKAEDIGTRTLEMMKGEQVLNFSFKKSNQTVTLPAKTKT
jgi:hypothetical protein